MSLKLNLGHTGQFCNKFSGSLQKLDDDCGPCAQRNQIISSQHGGVYSFGCAVIAKASLIPGDRPKTEEKYCDDPDPLAHSEKETTYGQLPNQVPQAMYKDLNGRLTKQPYKCN